MQITSGAFGHNGHIPRRYTCDDASVSPPLTFYDIPPGTESLALIMHGPDSPHGDFVHWLVWNIPADRQYLDEGNLPNSARQGTTGYGRAEYGPPCPTEGTGNHRYIFELFALDTMLGLPHGPGRIQLLHAMDGHILARAEFVGVYSR